MRRQIILILALVGALLAVPAVAQAHPSLEPRITALEAAVGDLQNRVGFLESRGVYTKGTTFFAPVGQSTHVQNCNEGDVATGGGWRSHGEMAEFRIVTDLPAQANYFTNTGWTITVMNETPATQKVDVFAVCLDPL